MSLFSSVAGFVRDEPPEAEGPAQSGQASVRRLPAHEKAPKRPQIRLSNLRGDAVDGGSSRGAVRVTPRSLQSCVHVTPLVDSTVIVKDDEVQPVEEGMEAQPSVPLTTEVLDVPSSDCSTLIPVPSPLRPSVALENSLGATQKGPISGSSSA
ncbi:hypothetical protein AXF42_Ash012367 [Apostasia shenzhenica]|uniref:Uncharacterized protein n=1 Tax=Apostasia shenzhenica TaxID=1088818 RepID=A0A2I0AD34_9ASPA|nr:hypothetical protein AXF42_Ash012367 [Apostasia shenzhenica]